MANETRFRTEAMTSRIAQLGIVDALIAGIALARRDLAVDRLRRTFEVLSRAWLAAHRDALRWAEVEGVYR
jgi:DNA-binding MurR/RpiR family transcriptional regulator